MNLPLTPLNSAFAPPMHRVWTDFWDQFQAGVEVHLGNGCSWKKACVHHRRMQKAHVPQPTAHPSLHRRSLFQTGRQIWMLPIWRHSKVHCFSTFPPCSKMSLGFMPTFLYALYTEEGEDFLDFTVSEQLWILILPIWTETCKITCIWVLQLQNPVSFPRQAGSLFYKAFQDFKC